MIPVNLNQLNTFLPLIAVLNLECIQFLLLAIEEFVLLVDIYFHPVNRGVKGMKCVSRLSYS